MPKFTKQDDVLGTLTRDTDLASEAARYRAEGWTEEQKAEPRRQAPARPAEPQVIKPVVDPTTK